LVRFLSTQENKVNNYSSRTMKIPCDEYMLANTVEEALALLAERRGKARIISGGSDLLLELQQGDCLPIGRLVDVTEIDELCALEIRDKTLFIGAAVTLARLANSKLVKAHAQALSDASSLMANPQVCNVATIGGNVAHALPAADGTIALLVLDAQANIVGSTGRRLVPMNSLFKGPGESTLDPCDDLLVGFHLPLREKMQSSAFARRVNPQGIALAMLNLAIWLERDGERIHAARVAVGPSGPVPRRMRAAEQVLSGQEYKPGLLDGVLEALLNEANFRTSPHRATAEYRRHLAGVLLKEAFVEAWERAGE
jgi:carbon-monoxide dehydrogenase medium subunit